MCRERNGERECDSLLYRAITFSVKKGLERITSYTSISHKKMLIVVGMDWDGAQFILCLKACQISKVRPRSCETTNGAMYENKLRKHWQKSMTTDLKKHQESS